MALENVTKYHCKVHVETLFETSYFCWAFKLQFSKCQVYWTEKRTSYTSKNSLVCFSHVLNKSASVATGRSLKPPNKWFRQTGNLRDCLMVINQRPHLILFIVLKIDPPFAKSWLFLPEAWWLYNAGSAASQKISSKCTLLSFPTSSKHCCKNHQK